MPTIAENLLALDAVKDEIKAKIGTNLGRTIGAAVPFTDYADYILPPVAWMPDPLWASLDDTADGQICMIVRDRDDLGVAARCAFTITATANYIVDWGDGTAPETVASTVMADHTYTLGAGTADSKGTTTFKVRISSMGTITRIKMESNVTGGFVKQTVLRVNIKAAGITSMLSAFYYCGLLQSVGDLNLPACTDVGNAFFQCKSLVSVGAISIPICTRVSWLFQKCPSLVSVGNLNLPACTAIDSMFEYCFNLVSVGNIVAPLCTNISSTFVFCRSLVSIGDISGIGTTASSVDATSAFISVEGRFAIALPNAKLTRITITGESARYSGITSLTFHPSSTFSGTSPQINVSYTMMNRTALVALFNLLPTLTGKMINITGCIGTAYLTAGDRAIATGKGWTITG